MLAEHTISLCSVINLPHRTLLQLAWTSVLDIHILFLCPPLVGRRLSCDHLLTIIISVYSNPPVCFFCFVSCGVFFHSFQLSHPCCDITTIYCPISFFILYDIGEKNTGVKTCQMGLPLNAQITVEVL